MSESNAILVTNVTKSYIRGSPVLRNISMRVERGTVYGFLGSSGCGKTTLLSCVLGLSRWQAGEIKVLGRNVVSNGTSQNNRIGYMPQDYALQLRLTPKEIITCYGYIHGMSRAAIEQKFLELSQLLGISSLASQYISSLSGGQMRRVSLAIALIHTPELIILDEPTVGLDPLLRVRIWEHLYGLTATRKLTVLLTTHYVEELRRAHMVGVMRHGRLVAEEEPNALTSKFGCSLLQDAVLAACRLDQQSRQVSHVISQSTGKVFKSSWKSKDLFPQEFIQGVTPLSFRKMDYLPDRDFTENVRKDSTISNMFRSIAVFGYYTALGIARDLSMMTVVVLLPLMMTIPTLLIVGKEPRSLDIGLVNHDQFNSTECTLPNDPNNSTLCLLLQHLSASGVLRPEVFNSRHEADEKIAQGNLWGYLEFPKGYSEHLEDRGMLQRFADNETISGSTANVRIDNSNFIVHNIILSSVYKGMLEFFEELARMRNVDSSSMKIPLHEGVPIYGDPDLSGTEFAAPAVALCCPLAVTLFVAPFLLLTLRTTGVLERLQVAGLGFTGTITGLTLCVLTFSILNIIEAYLALKYVVQIPILTTLPVFLLLCVVCALCGTSLGILSSITFADELTCIISGMILVPLLAFYMGMTVPQQSFPIGLRVATSYIPSVPLAEPLRSLMSRGVSLGHHSVWPGIAMTIPWILIGYMVSIIFKRRLYRW